MKVNECHNMYSSALQVLRDDGWSVTAAFSEEGIESDRYTAKKAGHEVNANTPLSLLALAVIVDRGAVHATEDLWAKMLKDGGQ